MTLELELFRRQWIILAFIIGVVLVASTILSYLAMWQTRTREEERARIPITNLKGFWMWFRATFPWLLILTIVASIVLGIFYPILKSIKPPNW
jgi:multisubunit Na+/H+ antiporter MnhB subunit